MDVLPWEYLSLLCRHFPSFLRPHPSLLGEEREGTSNDKLQHEFRVISCHAWNSRGQIPQNSHVVTQSVTAVGRRCQGRSVVALGGTGWPERSLVFLGNTRRPGGERRPSPGMRPERRLVPKARRAQQGPTQHGQGRGGEAQIQSLPYLVLHPRGQRGVVKIHHHLAGAPRHRHEAQQPGRHEADAAGAGDGGLGGAALGAVRAPHANHGCASCQHRQQAGGDHHGPGGAELGGQGQLGAVSLALVDAGAVPHALHPQPPRVGHGRDDVGARVCRAPPVGQDGGNEGPDETQQAQGEAEQLQGPARHGCPARFSE